MDERTAAVIAAAQRVLDAVVFDDSRAMLYIKMGDTEYGFAMDEKIHNPLAEAIVLLGAQMDAYDIANGNNETIVQEWKDLWDSLNQYERYHMYNASGRNHVELLKTSKYANTLIEKCLIHPVGLVSGKRVSYALTGLGTKLLEYRTHYGWS